MAKLLSGAVPPYHRSHRRAGGERQAVGPAGWFCCWQMAAVRWPQRTPGDTGFLRAVLRYVPEFAETASASEISRPLANLNSDFWNGTAGAVTKASGECDRVLTAPVKAPFRPLASVATGRYQQRRLEPKPLAKFTVTSVLALYGQRRVQPESVPCTNMNGQNDRRGDISAKPGVTRC